MEGCDRLRHSMAGDLTGQVCNIADFKTKNHSKRQIKAAGRCSPYIIDSA